MIDRHAWLLCALAWAWAGCIGTSPELQGELDLGPEEPGVGQGPEHRPGQPCLRCHGEAHTPGGELFVLAGTVYETPDDERGLAGVTVDFEDAMGRSFSARTNRAGTFFVRAERSGGGEDAKPARPGSDGSLRLSFEPAFPLRVKVHSGDREQVMRGLIWREGSCAACHGGDASAGSNGRIFLERPGEATP